MKVTHSCLPVRQDPRKKEKDFPRSTSEPWAAASSRDFKSPLRENPPSLLSLERVLWQRRTLMPPSALAGPLSPSGLLARLSPGPKSHVVEEAEGAGWGLHEEGGQSPRQAPPAPAFPARTASKPRYALFLCLRCTEGSASIFPPEEPKAK